MGTEPGEATAPTQPLPEDWRADSAERRLYLVLYRPGGADVLALARHEPVVIGREAPADHVIDDPNLSRRHLRITPGEGSAVIEDLDSRNGTYVSGERVRQTSLFPGQELRLGRLIGCLVLAGERAQAALDSDELVRQRARTPARRADEREPVVRGAAMTQVFDQVERLATASIPVLVHGETGTGKEVVARELHARGPRAAGRLVCLNCGAIPGQLVESIFFGHERGAFTGASATRPGAFEDADGGTLFLDEIGELAPGAQAALLRVIETRRLMRVGSSREIDVDVRIVAATHRDLGAMAAEGAFRTDLLYRLNAVTIELPPLRACPEMLPELVSRFVERANAINGRAVDGIEPDAMEVLRAHAWPGNVRELRNVIERAVVVTTAKRITLADLPRRSEAPASGPASSGTPSATPRSGAARNEASDIRSKVQDYEAELIRNALRDTGGNQTEAAKRLDMPLRTLVRKIKALDLKPKLR